MRLLQLLCACCLMACALACSVVQRPPVLLPATLELAQAHDIAWKFYGGRPFKPQIRVVAEANCGTPPNGFKSDVGCVGGLTISFYESWVLDTGDPPSRTALCHEDLHQDQARRGIFDWQHTLVDEWGRVLNGCNAALEAAGL